MAFDVYCGPLWRYIAQDWKTIGQQAAEAEGVGYQVIRPPRPLFAPSPSKLAQKAPQVRDAVVKQIRAAGIPIEPWSEDPKGEYFTDRPGWEGYYAVLLRFAYRSGACGPEPTTACVEPVQTDVFNACLRDDPLAFHLLAAELWVPCDSPFPLRMDIVSGERYASTTGGLLRSLRQLCDCLGYDDQELIASELDQPYPDASVEECCRYGLSILLQAAIWADRRRQVMILDY